jgi:hypothetical protein
MDQEEAAEASAGVIECRRGALQVRRTCEAEEAIAQVFTLQQDENEKEHDQGGHRQW